MEIEDIQKLVNQIKKYDLTKAFNNTEEFEKWLFRLNKKQLQNFNNLTVEPSLIMFPKELLIDENLLNCTDYNKRINAMLKLTNGEDCYHLFKKLCSPNFLNSKHYYEDMEMVSKAATVRYVLWVINEDSFIKSKYHKEDLQLIIEAQDTEKAAKNKLDWLVAESLATVAANNDSIKSPYHHNDMELIAHSGSECLQMIGSYPERGINKLAINKTSLNDKYHLENMQILSKNPIASKYLYNIMTNPQIIKGKNYRDEVQALVNAKSKITARAIYYYIVNPKNHHSFDLSEELYDVGLDFRDIHLIIKRTRVQGNSRSSHPKYLEYLKVLNQIDDKFVMFIESLTNLLSGPYQEYDLNLMFTITDKNIFMDLYTLITDEIFIASPHHVNDANLISQTSNEKIRNLLLEKATNQHSINSNNHEYDMQYITKLDLDSLEEDEERFQKIYYYLFNPKGIDHIEHIDKLEKLYKGEMINIEETSELYEYINNLAYTIDKQSIDSNNKNNSKILSKFKKIKKRR